MKQSIKIYVVGALLIAPVLGVVANKVFAQTTPSSPLPGGFGASGRGEFMGGGYSGPAFSAPRTFSDSNFNQFGRYQLVIDSSRSSRYIFDTATGRFWVQVNAGEWVENTPKELEKVN